MRWLKQLFSVTKKKIEESKDAEAPKKKVKAEQKEVKPLSSFLPPTGVQSVHGKHKDGVIPNPKSGRGQRLSKKLNAMAAEDAYCR